MASENTGVKGGCTDAVAEFGRMFGLPEAEIGTQAGGDLAPVGKAKGAGGVPGYT